MEGFEVGGAVYRQARSDLRALRRRRVEAVRGGGGRWRWWWGGGGGAFNSHTSTAGGECVHG